MVRLIILVMFVAFLSGCLAFGVPYTDDPNKKLDLAVSLFGAGRLGRSEQFINEGINKCKENKDTECLAKGYLFHALFLKNPALYNAIRHYDTKGFLDKTVTFDTRFEKADEYLNKALALKPQNKKVHEQIMEMLANPGNPVHSVQDNNKASGFLTSSDF